jgi:hypothetical protein
VEEFRQWLQALMFDEANHARALLGEQVPRRWQVNAEAVVFYFELLGCETSALRNPLSAVRKISRDAARNPVPPDGIESCVKQ